MVSVRNNSRIAVVRMVWKKCRWTLMTDCRAARAHTYTRTRTHTRQTRHTADGRRRCRAKPSGILGACSARARPDKLTFVCTTIHEWYIWYICAAFGEVCVRLSLAKMTRHDFTIYYHLYYAMVGVKWVPTFQLDQVQRTIEEGCGVPVITSIGVAVVNTCKQQGCKEYSK